MFFFLYSVDQSAKFVEKSKRGNLVPLSQCIFSDHLTPVLAYRCLVNKNDHEAPSFLIESVVPGLHTLTVVSINDHHFLVAFNFSWRNARNPYYSLDINHLQGRY